MPNATIGMVQDTSTPAINPYVPCLLPRVHDSLRDEAHTSQKEWLSYGVVCKPEKEYGSCQGFFNTEYTTGIAGSESSRWVQQCTLGEAIENESRGLDQTMGILHGQGRDIHGQWLWALQEPSADCPLSKRPRKADIVPRSRTSSRRYERSWKSVIADCKLSFPSFPITMTFAADSSLLLFQDRTSEPR